MKFSTHCKIGKCSTQCDKWKCSPHSKVYPWALHCNVPIWIVGNTRTTERGGESVVYKLKQFYAFLNNY
jgi:hypothetical protein